MRIQFLFTGAIISSLFTGVASADPTIQPPPVNPPATVTPPVGPAPVVPPTYVPPDASQFGLTNQYALQTNRPPQATTDAFLGTLPWSMTPAPGSPGAGMYADFCGGSQGVYAQALQAQGVNAVTVDVAPWSGAGEPPPWYVQSDLYQGGVPLPPESVAAGSCVWGAVGPYGTVAQQQAAMQNMAGTLKPGATLTVGPFATLNEAYVAAQGTPLRPFAVHNMDGGVGVTYVNGFQGNPFTTTNVTVLTGGAALTGAAANELGGPGWAAANSGLWGAGSGYYYTGTYAGAAGGLLTAGAGFAGSYYGAQAGVYLVQQAGVTNPILITVAGNTGSVVGGAVATGGTAAALYSIGVPIAGVAAGATTGAVFLTVTGVGLAAGTVAVVGYTAGSALATYTTVPLAEAYVNWKYADANAALATGINASNSGTCTCNRSTCESTYLGLSSSCTAAGTRQMTVGGQIGCNYQNGQKFYQPDDSWVQYDGCTFTPGGVQVAAAVAN